MEKQFKDTKESYADIMRGIAQILLDAANSEEELQKLREALNIQRQAPQVQQKGTLPEMPF